MNEKSYKYNYEVVKTEEVIAYCENDAYPEYLLGDTLEEAEDTFKEFSVYINRLARFYSIISKIDRAEFFGEGIISLGKAKRDYNKKMGEFRPYAKYIVSDAMNEVIRKNRTVVKIPSYIYKANKIVNRIKKISEEYVTDGNFDYILYADITDIGLPEEIMEDINANKFTLERAAARASTSYDELLNRACQLPLVTKFEVNEFDSVSCDDTYMLLPIKLFVKEIMTFLTEDQQAVAKLIMEDKDKSEISRITGNTPYWVNQQMEGIKSTFLGIKGG